MKTHAKNLPLLPALITGLVLILAGQMRAQTFTVLHSFNGSDGDYPTSLILSSNTLYGTTYDGGNSNSGTAFAIGTDGSGFKSLYSFTGFNGNIYTSINSGKANVAATLILSANTLYGADYGGGYGGSSLGSGTNFKANPDGTGLTTLYSFTPTSGPQFGVQTNSDGAHPLVLILSGNALYGVAAGGGGSGNGTVFRLALPGPQIAIYPSGGDVILNWPTNASGLTLQSTTNLVSPVWTTNSPVPVVVNGQ